MLTRLLQAQPKKLRIDDEQEKKYHDKLAARAAQIVKSANIVWGMYCDWCRYVMDHADSV